MIRRWFNIYFFQRKKATWAREDFGEWENCGSNGKPVILAGAEVDHSFPNLVNVLALSRYFLNFVHPRASSWESGWEDLSNQLLSPSRCPENLVDLKARLNMMEVLQLFIQSSLWSPFNEMEGPVLLSFLLLPILTSSSKEPTPQFHQSSPFQALAQVSGQAPLMVGWVGGSGKQYKVNICGIKDKSLWKDVL